MLDVKHYCKAAIKVIEDYLEGTLSDKEAADWALDVIAKTRDLENLPVSILSAIQCLADLHDAGESWCPSRDELERWKAELEKELLG